MRRIGFCSTWPATDPNANSGYAFSIRRQLMKRYHVTDLLFAPRWPHVLFLGYKLAARMAGRYYGWEREPIYLEALARAMDVWSRDLGLDAIVCPTTIPPTRYRGNVPVLIVADQVFPSALETYLRRPSLRYRREGLAQERQSLSRCAAASFPSRHAVDAAVRECDADPARLHEIPWGANLPTEPGSDDVTRVLRNRGRDACSLVFIGREWERKGGDLVLATIDALRSSGVPSRLTVIGTVPPGNVSSEVTIIPFIDKQTAAGWQHFAEILCAAHFLLVPSRAEAYGQVYCEAAAFGVPSVARAVGGVTSIIRDGHTGILVEPNEATPAEIARRITAVWADRARYERMAIAARRDYEERLNWTSFGERFSAVLESVICSRTLPLV